MPFASQKQRAWMHINKPEMAARWENEMAAKKGKKKASKKKKKAKMKNGMSKHVWL